MSQKEICDATFLDEICLWTLNADDSYDGPTNFPACAADDSASFAAVPTLPDAAQQIKHELPSKLQII
jgi:hypothetical protein